MLPWRLIVAPDLALQASGSSNAAWRRSVTLALRLGAARGFGSFEGFSWARLRFRAAMRSITGGGTLSAHGLMGSPFILALDQLPQGFLVAVPIRRRIESCGLLRLRPYVVQSVRPTELQ
jgi:hypothetical protein